MGKGRRGGRILLFPINLLAACFTCSYRWYIDSRDGNSDESSLHVCIAWHALVNAERFL